MKLFVANKVFLVNEDGHILLLRESPEEMDNTNVGTWDVPGGRLEVGEDPREATKREVREEAGIEINQTQPFAVRDWRPVVRGEEWQIVGIYHWVHIGDMKPRLSQEHDEFKWVDPRSVDASELIPGLYDVIQEYVRQTTT